MRYRTCDINLFGSCAWFDQLVDEVVTSSPETTTNLLKNGGCGGYVYVSVFPLRPQLWLSRGVT